MSHETPDIPLPGPHNLASRRANLPGCGIAAYAIVLFAIFVTGVTGVVTAYSSLVGASQGSSINRLTYGGNVPPPMLGPLRSAGLIAPDEIPDLVHVETMLGTEVCAISRGRLVRLDSKGPRAMELSTIREVVEESDGVRVTGEIEIFCPFGPDEGGDRFARILNTPGLREP